jgi:formate dehydrogenase
MKRTRGKKGRITGRVLDQTAFNQVNELIGDESKSRDMLIEHLHKIQDTYHFISNRHIIALAKIMNLSMAAVYETATFYHHFDITNENEIPPPEITVRVCESVTCEMFGAKKLIKELKLATDSKKIRIQPVPCVGRCAAAPVAVAGTYPIEHAGVETVLSALSKNKLSDSLPKSYIDYDTYKNNGGYKTLIDCIDGKYKREDIISLLEDSSLRGLGGAGFPTGQKWRILSEKKSPKLIAINIDEGEPGTFKDRYYLENDPHRFIEGTLIAHWAIEADDIYIYLRDEYAGCRMLLEKELDKIKTAPPCKLPTIHLRRGAGAYICGEESAMIESIEGKAGMPRLRPPYVADVGLFGHPTLEQNMETMHWIRDIIEKGPNWFSSNGRRERKGLRSFSVSGRVKKPGVQKVQHQQHREDVNEAYQLFLR